MTNYLVSNIFKEQETPAGNSVFKSKSKIEGEVVLMSIKRLYRRSSKCSRESLSIWGERRTQNLFIFVGRETTPFKLHSVLDNVTRNC